MSFRIRSTIGHLCLQCSLSKVAAEPQDLQLPRKAGTLNSRSSRFPPCR